jgi:hypothetical protein
MQPYINNENNQNANLLSDYTNSSNIVIDKADNIFIRNHNNDNENKYNNDSNIKHSRIDNTKEYFEKNHMKLNKANNFDNTFSSIDVRSPKDNILFSNESYIEKQPVNKDLSQIQEEPLLQNNNNNNENKQIENSIIEIDYKENIDNNDLNQEKINVNNPLMNKNNNELKNSQIIKEDKDKSSIIILNEIKNYESSNIESSVEIIKQNEDIDINQINKNKEVHLNSFFEIISRFFDTKFINENKLYFYEHLLLELKSIRETSIDKYLSDNLLILDHKSKVYIYKKYLTKLRRDLIDKKINRKFSQYSNQKVEQYIRYKNHTKKEKIFSELKRIYLIKKEWIKKTYKEIKKSFLW